MEVAEEKLLLEKIRKKDGAAMRRLFDSDYSLHGISCCQFLLKVYKGL